MDAKDLLLLAALDRNARAPLSELARTTRLAKETVRYRVQRMLTDGTIQRCMAIMDGTRLGVTYYQVLLKLQNVDEKRKQGIITTLTAEESVNWVANLEGEFDIGIILAARTPSHLQALFERLSSYSRFIMRKTISVNIRGEFFPRRYLLETTKTARRGPSRTAGKSNVLLDPKAYDATSEPIVLDPLDTQICTLLAKDARTPLIEIARHTNVSAVTIARRIKVLEHTVIAGYGITLRQAALGQTHHKLLIYLTNATPERTREFRSFVGEETRVIAIIRTLAEWDYEIDVEVKDAEQLKGFVMRLTERFSDIVRDYRTLRIVDMPKYLFSPNIR